MPVFIFIIYDFNHVLMEHLPFVRWLTLDWACNGANLHIRDLYLASLTLEKKTDEVETLSALHGM